MANDETGDMGRWINSFIDHLDSVVGQVVKATGLDNKWIPIICGVFGAALGILGMFIGATLLSIGYRIFMAWVNDGLANAPRDHDIQ